MAPKEASLLGISRELRQQIYGYVMRLSLDYEIAKYADGACDAGFRTCIYRNRDSMTISWVSLLLSCKYINTELSAYMSSPSILGNEDLHTYQLDIRGTSRGTLMSSQWQRISCPPSKARRVLVNYYVGINQLDRRIHIWGSGGPMPILRQLYQTLNLLLQNGPILSRSTALQHPLNLESLHFIVIPDKICDEGGIESFLKDLGKCGFLRGYIDRIYVKSSAGDEDFAVEGVENVEVPSFWDGYGFEWGPDYKKSVQWKDQ
ncbi:hypothetical protein F4808DRAFT_408153 [Astrocystis sublimbata]|nr:hypothetical protein F4808DRAFT_408153 [Astrocystis sublimbata]